MIRLIQRFLGWFRKKPKLSTHGEGNPKEKFKPNWGIIIPHTKKAPGASSKQKNINEYEYALIMCSFMRFIWDTRDNGGVYGAANRLKQAHLINATLEPHKNAFNKKAKGFELLVMKGDKLSGHYAHLIADAFADKFPERKLRGDKGIKWVTKGDRGFSNLQAAKDAGIDVAILSESFFIDNPDEWIEPKEMAEFWKEVLI